MIRRESAKARHRDISARLATRATQRSVDSQSTNSFTVSLRSRNNSTVNTVTRPMYPSAPSKCTYVLTPCPASVSFVERRFRDLGCCKDISALTPARNRSNANTVAGHSLTAPTSVRTSRPTQTSRSTAVRPVAKLSRGCHYFSNTKMAAAPESSYTHRHRFLGDGCYDNARDIITERNINNTKTFQTYTDLGTNTSLCVTFLL